MPLLVLIFGLLIALTPLPSIAQVIHACVGQNGQLRLVETSDECRHNETPISWNQAGPESPVPHVFDRNGRDLGPYKGGSEFLDESTGVIVGFRFFGELNGPQRVVFLEANCAGQAYVQGFFNQLIPVPTSVSPTGYLVGSTVDFPTTDNTNYLSSASSQACDNTPGVIGNGVVPAYVFTGNLGLTFPLPAPLWVGLPESP